MVTIYHNPRCSKSRAALALLEERGVRPEVRRYLEQPPTIEELSALLDLLGLEPLDVMSPRWKTISGQPSGSTLSKGAPAAGASSRRIQKQRTTASRGGRGRRVR